MLALLAAHARAQEPPDDSPRRLAGHVMRAVKEGLAPMRGMMVTLHRVGADRAGPVDSMRTAANGAYAFTYRPSGSGDAVYLASVGYEGIMYFSTPASSAQAVPDGDITVFDTTSGPVPIRTAGHHVIVSAPRSDGRREVEEVFELSNDSSVTRIARGDSVPVWSSVAPNGATGVQGAPTSDIAPAAIIVRGRRVELFAPISPGMRQLAYGYALDAGTFPLLLPLATSTQVLEVLVEEQSGYAEGGGLAELSPVSKGGRTFRRFLAQDVPANAELKIVVPASVSHSASRMAAWIAGGSAVLMALALAWTLMRRTSLEQWAGVSSRDDAAALLHEIAALDAAHTAGTLPDESVAYDRRRSELKARLARALAMENRAT